MTLLTAPPDEVATSLRELQEQAPPHESNGSTELADPTITFAVDIAGTRFGPQWVVVDTERVWVFAPNGNSRAALVQSVPLADIRAARAEVHVGNGTLEVDTADETIRIARFSHAGVAEAHAVARAIDARSKGDEVRSEEIEAEARFCPKCGRSLPKDTQVCPACIDRRAVMVRLFRFLRPYVHLSAIGALVILASTAADVAPPWIGGRIVDALTLPGLARATRWNGLIYWVVMLALSRVALAVLMYVQRRLNPWLGGRILMDIRVQLYNKFNELSLSYYDKRSVGSVMSRITNDADNLWDFLTDGVPWLLSTLLTLVLTTIVLVRLNWSLALLMLAPAPFIYVLNSWFMPRARGKWRHVWHRISRMYSMLNSTLNGMRVVKAFAQEGRENERFEDRNRQVFEASYAANAMWATYWPTLGLLISVGSYIIWIAGGARVLAGVMTVGALTAFNGYLFQFYMPFQNLSRVMDWMTRSLTAAERVFEVLDTEPEIREALEPVHLDHIEGSVRFDNVSFSYDRGKRVLENFSLDVAPGEMIGLVGHSGAGKSTLINLLSRFYDVTEGAILVDGVDIRSLARPDFRNRLGIVLQEPFLFPGTVRDNIAYAKPDATREEIMRAAKAANCHEFILKFPDGYDTQVGDRGQRLSGGERQRISIARAILHDPRILILDEATASVDTDTEKQIQEAIQRLVADRTTFAIAHRLSTLRNASRLVVMKDGKMVECGTHDELMELDGEYARLVNIQTEVNRLRVI